MGKSMRLRAMIKYYLWLSNSESGPFTIGQLRSMWNAGGITSATLFRTDQNGHWFELSSIIDSLVPRHQAVLKAETYSAAPRHVKATTELTSKPIKAAMALFGLGFWACLFVIPFVSHEAAPLFAIGSLLCLICYFFTKVVRWRENE